jgi:hypothetical protein
VTLEAPKAEVAAAVVAAAPKAGVVAAAVAAAVVAAAPKAEVAAAVVAAAPKAAEAVAVEPEARMEVGEPGALGCSRRSLLESDFALCHLPPRHVGMEGC